MRFTAVLSRTARTEWRTAPIKGTYKPGKTFGFLVRRIYACCNYVQFWKGFFYNLDTHSIWWLRNFFSISQISRKFSGLSLAESNKGCNRLKRLLLKICMSHFFWISTHVRRNCQPKITYNVRFFLTRGSIPTVVCFRQAMNWTPSFLSHIWSHFLCQNRIFKFWRQIQFGPILVKFADILLQRPKSKKVARANLSRSLFSRLQKLFCRYLLNSCCKTSGKFVKSKKKLPLVNYNTMQVALNNRQQSKILDQILRLGLRLP